MMSAQQLSLMDIHEANLAFCRHRLEGMTNVQYLTNNGYDFMPLESATVTSIFCYDAMVHFSPDLVESYLRDAFRIPVPGGLGLFHHSNYDADPSVQYGLNPQARNKMTLEAFEEHAKNAGLELVESGALPWGGIPDLDGLSLVRKALLPSHGHVHIEDFHPAMGLGQRI